MTRTPMVALTSLLLLSASSLTSTAAIVELDPDEFDAASAGGPLFLEDFESYVEGAQAVPMVLVNGVVFDNPAPFVIGGAGGHALIGNNLPVTEARRFAGFAPGTTLFGIDLLVDDSDEFDITVQTTGGDSLFISAQRGNAFNGFFGFQLTGDSLLSVAIANVGGPSGPGDGGGGIGNPAFDNLAVNAMPAPVPLPGALAMLALPGMVLARRAVRR